METKVRCIEVRTTDGKPILSLHISEKEIAAKPQDKEQNNQTNNHSATESPMTDAQKRYLFRVLAEQGFEQDKAHQRLKTLFGVELLQDVNKFEASKMIERLLEEVEKK